MNYKFILNKILGYAKYYGIYNDIIKDLSISYKTNDIYSHIISKLPHMKSIRGYDGRMHVDNIWHPFLKYNSFKNGLKRDVYIKFSNTLWEDDYLWDWISNN